MEDDDLSLVLLPEEGRPIPEWHKDMPWYQEGAMDIGWHAVMWACHGDKEEGRRWWKPSIIRALDQDNPTPPYLKRVTHIGRPCTIYRWLAALWQSYQDEDWEVLNLMEQELMGRSFSSMPYKRQEPKPAPKRTDLHADAPTRTQTRRHQTYSTLF